MQFSSFILVAIFAISTARCAPALDAKTLSDNAKEAQQLNAKFLTLKLTDPCQGQETACIDGDIATCKDGKFDTSQGVCQRTLECFAIPDIRAPGTQLLCSTEINVLGLIEACGVDGGITGSDDVSSSSQPITGTIPGNPDDGSDEPTTVTVTVFASPLATTTTTTISPSEASSILQKLLTEGQPPAPSSTSLSPIRPAAGGLPNNVPPSPSTSSVSSSSTVPIILLTPGGAGGEVPNSTPAPSPTTSTDASPSGPVIQLVAATEDPNPTAPPPAPAAPTPTPTPNGVQVGGGGGGGYGY